MGHTRGRTTLRAVLAAGAMLLLPVAPAAGGAATPAASPSPTTTASPAPAGSPAATDPGGASSTASVEQAQDELATATIRVQGAQRALDAAEVELDAALAALRKARDDVRAAEAADEEARVALETAIAAERKTEREIADVRAHVQDTRATLGAVAREAYRGGTLATLEVVLEADSPGEFADRYAGLQAVMKAGEGVLGELAVSRADLTNKEARLAALRELQQQLRAKAAATLAAKKKAQESAQTAATQHRRLVAQHEAALEAAEQARLEDYERYQRFLAQSRSVAADLAGWAAGPGSSVGTGDFVRPGTGPVTSNYGPRLHPILGYVKTHTGIDIGVGDGYVYAADSGTVVTAAYGGGYGNMVVLDHGQHGGRQLATLYAHQARLFVSAGQTVARGQRIGVIGSTGYSTGPHLHFEVRLDGTPTDPWPWIVDAPMPSAPR